MHGLLRGGWSLQSRLASSRIISPSWPRLLHPQEAYMRVRNMSSGNVASYVDKHPDFKKAQQSRPDFNHRKPIQITKSPNPDWRFGDGVQKNESNNTSPDNNHVEINPYAEGRPMMSNYRLLVSGIAPRPIGFLSTISGDGLSEKLSPFSYFQVIDHDPPTFVVGFSARAGRPKDTYRNLLESKECVINMVSENMIEAVSATSVDAPYGVSEWDISGLTKAPSATVKPARVQESVFSVEGKLVDTKEFTSHARPGMSIASLAVIEATRFWVRADAVNADGSNVDLNVLRPIAQLGGISYGRISEVFELPRKSWVDALQEEEWLKDLTNKAAVPAPESQG